jgi:hypothetical protein
VPDIADMLANRTWLRRSWPFPHVVARDLFTATYYRALADQVRSMLERGLSEQGTLPGQFSRSIPGYDAYGVAFDRLTQGPAAVFLSRAWRDMLCSLFGIGPTPYVFAGAHYHTPGSHNGFVHNDFNPVWFRRADENDIQVPNQQLCAYKTGEGSADELDKVEVVRGAVVIFYLLNECWHPGDGGETGLYQSGSACIAEPVVRCAPEANSLIAFECTPRSFHTFLANHRISRTSIIMWVHRTLEEAAARHGAENFERWNR